MAGFLRDIFDIIVCARYLWYIGDISKQPLKCFLELITDL